MRILATILAATAYLCAYAEVPAFVDTAADTISFAYTDTAQTAAWHKAASRLDSLERHASSSVVRVLHIGDSHIQAEFVTNELRSMLQQDYGNAGRGLVSPLRLAGTNQPVDYFVTAPDGSNWRRTRLLKLPWEDVPGVTGIAATPTQATSATFRAIGQGHKTTYATILTSTGAKIYAYGEPQDSVTTTLEAGESLYGAILENGRPGLLYSAIGNNGACFTDYLLIPGFVKKTEVFHPDIIILSMGTNEGFSLMTDAEIRRCAENLLRLLRKAHPGAAMLVLTPMECQINRNHGYRPLSPYYDINGRVADAAHLITEAAHSHGVPVWDFYTIAGGRGASDKWINAGLFSKDRIHLNVDGYKLQARLMYTALRAVLAR